MEWDYSFDELTQKSAVVKRKNVQKIIEKYEKKLLAEEKRNKRPGYCVLTLTGDSGVGKTFLHNLYQKRAIIYQSHDASTQDDDKKKENIISQMIIGFIDLGFEMRCSKTWLENNERYRNTIEFAKKGIQDKLDFKSRYLPSVIEAAESINPWGKVAIKAVQHIAEEINAVSEKTKLSAKINSQIDEFLKNMIYKNGADSTSAEILKRAINLDLKLLYVTKNKPILIFVDNASDITSMLPWILSNGISDNVIWILVNPGNLDNQAIKVDANITLYDYNRAEFSQYIQRSGLDIKEKRTVKNMATKQPSLYNPRELQLRTFVYNLTKEFPENHDEALKNLLANLPNGTNQEAVEYVNIMAALGEWNKDIFHWVYKGLTNQDFSLIQYDKIIKSYQAILMLSTYGTVSFPAEIENLILNGLDVNFILKIKKSQIKFYEEQKSSEDHQSIPDCFYKEKILIEYDDNIILPEQLKSALSSLSKFVILHNCNDPEVCNILNHYGYDFVNRTNSYFKAFLKLANQKNTTENEEIKG